MLQATGEGKKTSNNKDKAPVWCVNDLIYLRFSHFTIFTSTGSMSTLVPPSLSLKRIEFFSLHFGFKSLLIMTHYTQLNPNKLLENILKWIEPLP